MITSHLLKTSILLQRTLLDAFVFQQIHYIRYDGHDIIKSAQMAEWLWRVTQAIASAFNVVYSRREICKGSNPFLSIIF